jgi:hypothetical protein
MLYLKTEEPQLVQVRLGPPVHGVQYLGQADEAKRNGSVRATQKLGQ